MKFQDFKGFFKKRIVKKLLNELMSIHHISIFITFPDICRFLKQKWFNILCRILKDMPHLDIAATRVAC